MFAYVRGIGAVISGIIPFLLVFLLHGCATSSKMTIAATASLLEDIVAATNKQPDLRIVRQGTPAYLMLLDGMVESWPGNEQILLAAAQGYASYASVFIEEDDIIVATAATTADTTKSAMIVGVATHPDYRKKGYASALVHFLMKEYLEHQKKSVCLFYDNPKAGAIYLRLGFEYMGTWTMLMEHD